MFDRILNAPLIMFTQARYYVIFSVANISLHDKCPNTEFFLVHIFLYQSVYRKMRTRKNSVFGTIFTQWSSSYWKFSSILLVPRVFLSFGGENLISVFCNAINTSTFFVSKLFSFLPQNGKKCPCSFNKLVALTSQSFKSFHCVRYSNFT